VSTRTRLLALATACTFAVALAAWVLLARAQARAARAAELHALRAAARSYRIHERGDTEKLAAALDALAAIPELQRAFVARDREALLRAARPILAELGRRDRVSRWYFVEPDRTCFLRVHLPELHGDRIGRTTLAAAERTGEVAAGAELGKTAFALRVVKPWRDAGGALLGYLELGEDIRHVLERMKEQVGDDFALVILKKHLDEREWTAVAPTARNTWNDRPDVVVVDTTTFTDGIVDYAADLESVPDEGLLVERIERGGRTLVRGVFPVRDVDGRRVGALFALHDVTGIAAAASSGRRDGLLGALAAAALAAAVLGFALERRVFARIAVARARLEAWAARGKGPHPDSPRFHSADDLGKLELLVPDDGAPARDGPPGDTARNGGST
jgi:hypothetical protein